MADTETACWAYQRHRITTVQDAGEWWARARQVKQDGGGARPVRGGPWKSKPEARTAAEAFCDSGRAR